MDIKLLFCFFKVVFLLFFKWKLMYFFFFDNINNMVLDIVFFGFVLVVRLFGFEDLVVVIG